eukprot:1153155-Pelagomonas_calceolata.AAC.3
MPHLQPYEGACQLSPHHAIHQPFPSHVRLRACMCFSFQPLPCLVSSHTSVLVWGATASAGTFGLQLSCPHRQVQLWNLFLSFPHLQPYECACMGRSSKRIMHELQPSHNLQFEKRSRTKLADELPRKEGKASKAKF